MSEPSNNDFQYARWIIIIATVIIITGGLIYVGGYFAIPKIIESAYNNRDCQSVLSRDHTYRSLYPVLFGSRHTSSMVMECAVYTLAVLNQEGENWQDSYNAFNVYYETYPEGLYFAEVREHMAVVLTHLAEDEMAQNKYSEAFVNVDLVLMNYGDTEIFQEAKKLKADLYTGWGCGLRNSGNFFGAEKVFKEFQTWAKSEGNDEYAVSAQLELSTTYLAWGLALQSQKLFDEAKTKFDIAMSTDPVPSFDAGPSAEVKANQGKFHVDWGDYFIEQNNLDAAIAQYETAVSLSETDESRDALARGYLIWAEALSNNGDFIGALARVDVATGYAATDAADTLIDDTRSNVYIAFSESYGEQALIEMQNAVKLICEQHKQPSIPIFGLDDENVRANIFGVDEELPQNVKATTPGSLHYVICVDEINAETIQFVNFYNYFLYRIREDWTLSLWDVTIGDVVETYTIEGVNPQPLPTDPYEIAQGGRSQSFFGRPDMSELADWLLTVME